MKKVLLRWVLAVLACAIIFSVESCAQDNNKSNPDSGQTPAPEDPDDPEESELKVEVPANGTFDERMLGAKINGKEVVESVTELENTASNLFAEGRYEIEFVQHVDQKDPNSKTFTQRVLVSIAAEDRPVVFVTQGYGLGGGWDFENSNYTEELAEELECNQVVVEHRYFGGSIPSPRDWTYHTIDNQLRDLHRINRVLREVFKGQKFISTGRSKGGQTAIYYETYFPADIDIAVPYVAPICFEFNDRRHPAFLKKVGSDERRAKIKAFQQALFDRRDALVPLFAARLNKADYSAEWDVVFDLCVLEYSFMCWQYYNPTRPIPATTLSDAEMLNELGYISPASYFSHKDDPAFTMNLLREGGYYGYDVEQFENAVITPEQCATWLQEVRAPLDGRNVSFDPTLTQRVKKFLKENSTEKMIFIYGAYDTWSAAAVERPNFDGKSNMFRYDCPEMDHGTFISSFNATKKAEIMGKIKKWLKE